MSQAAGLLDGINWLIDKTRTVHAIDRGGTCVGENEDEDDLWNVLEAVRLAGRVTSLK